MNHNTTTDENNNKSRQHAKAALIHALKWILKKYINYNHLKQYIFHFQFTMKRVISD